MKIKEKIDSFVSKHKLEWKKHALQRIFERGISRDETKQAIVRGKIIEAYADDYPYPSFLIGYIDTDRPLHVLVAIDEAHEICYIVTVYKPSIKYFENDLVTRKNDGSK